MWAWNFAGGLYGGKGGSVGGIWGGGVWRIFHIWRNPISLARCLGFKARGLGFRVQGLGLKVEELDDDLF